MSYPTKEAYPDGYKSVPIINQPQAVPLNGMYDIIIKKPISFSTFI